MRRDLTDHWVARAMNVVCEGKEVLECKVQVETEMLSPFDLAASWRAHQEYFQPSRVRGTHDVTINPGLEGRAKVCFTVFILYLDTHRSVICLEI